MVKVEFAIKPNVSKIEDNTYVQPKSMSIEQLDEYTRMVAPPKTRSGRHFHAKMVRELINKLGS